MQKKRKRKKTSSKHIKTKKKQKKTNISAEKKQLTAKKRKNKSRRKKQQNFLLIFAIFMIMSGISLLLYPIVGNYLANRERSEAVTNYDQTLKKINQEEIKQQLKLANEYNEAIFTKQRKSQSAAYQEIANEGGVMGTIDIPAIGIKTLPFYHGTSYKTLNKGLGHFENSSIPVGGKNTRSVITGHSGVKNQILFTDIRNLQVGDLFFINILGKRLAYEIESFEEVLPSEVDKVKIIPGKDRVTLLTCTPPGINTYRLLVNGQRIPYKQALTKKMIKRNFWSYQNIVLTTLALCFVIFLMLGLIYRNLKKKARMSIPQISFKAKKNIRKLIAVTRGVFIVLLVAMVGVLVVAIYGYFQMKKETRLEPINVGVAQELFAFNTDKILQANYEEKQITSVNVTKYANAKNNIQKNINNWGIGKLIIPDVGIDLPILAGLANENLLNGVATFRQDQSLGKGNYVLLAHNIYQQDLLLHRIKDLKIHAIIYATDFKKMYSYEVFLNQVINDTEIAVLEKNAPSIITLLRCEGDIGTTKRRVVQGKLKKIEELKDVSPQKITSLSLTGNTSQKKGILIKRNPVSVFDQFSMKLAAGILADPLQTSVPLFLVLVLPVIFLSLLRE